MIEKSLGPRLSGSIRVCAVLAALLAALPVPAAPAGEAERGGLSLGYGTSLLMRGQWGHGFEVAGLLVLWKRGGVHVGANLISQSSAFSIGEGVMVDTGVWQAFRPERTRSVVLLGLSFSSGHPLEADLDGFGMHLGFRQEFWLGDHIGFYGRAMLRLWLTADELDAVSPSVGAGVAFRL